MPHDRFYAPLFSETDSTISLKGNEAHHLAHVMRKGCGHTVEVINGKGLLATAKIVTIEKESSLLEIQDLIEGKKSPKFLTLAMGFLKQPHLELAIEKCTELGVDEFFLFPAARSEKKELSDHNLKRLEGIIISASKQCGRLYFPKVFIKKTLNECLEKDTLTFFGHLSGKETLSSKKEALQQAQKITFFIGPESGWAAAEVEQLVKSAIPISLNNNILRAETAAIATAVLLSQNY